MFKKWALYFCLCSGALVCQVQADITQEISLLTTQYELLKNQKGAEQVRSTKDYIIKRIYEAEEMLTDKILEEKSKKHSYKQEIEETEDLEAINNLNKKVKSKDKKIKKLKSMKEVLLAIKNRLEK